MSHVATFRRPILTGKRILVTVLVLATFLALMLVVRGVFEKPDPQVRTVEVQRGTVRTVVTGTGTVEPVSQQNLSFGQEGTLTEVRVKVGDRVRAGQVLAKIDPSRSQAALQQAVGGLQQAQARLNNASQQNAVQAAEHDLAAAQQALRDTENQVNKIIKAGQDLVSSDKQQLSFDRNTLDREQGKLERDEEILERDRSRLRAAQARFRAHGCDRVTPPNPSPTPSTSPSPSSPRSDVCTADRQAVEQAQSAVRASEANVAADREAVRVAKARVLADEAKLSADERQLAIDRANGQKAINDAQAAVVSAADALESQRISRPNEIAEQRGGVTSAQAQVNDARRTLDETTLVSPFDGTVVSVNAAVGERVAPSGTTTPLAPSSTAPAPSTATDVAPAGQAGAAGATLATPFLVLGDVRSFQVVVPFAEADAAKVQPGQKADVTLDALPDLTLPATVVAVGPGPTVIQNVTNYFVTLSLDRLDPRLRAGMTANAEITAAEIQNVLVVPSAVIQRVGEQTFVTVLLDDGTQRRMLVQTGAVGDTTTDVTAGLEAGDRVVLPSVRAPSRQRPSAGSGQR